MADHCARNWGLRGVPKAKSRRRLVVCNSQGAVMIVTIVSLSREKPMIKFETIVRDSGVSLGPQQRQRPRNTPIVRQSIIASHVPELNNNSPVTVSPEESLPIKFEEAFCRQPNPPEQDLELHPDQLRRISRAVWEAERLMSTDREA